MTTFKDIIRTDRDCILFANEMFKDAGSCENTLLSMLLLFNKHHCVLEIEQNFCHLFKLLNSDFEAVLQDILNNCIDPMVENKYHIYRSFDIGKQKDAIQKTLIALYPYLQSETEDNERKMFEYLKHSVFANEHYSHPKYTIIPYKESYAIFTDESCYYHRTTKRAEKCGFQVQLFDTDFATDSHHYNPFMYMRTNSDYFVMMHHFFVDTSNDELQSNHFMDLLGFVMMEVGLFMMEHIDISERNIKNWIRLTETLLTKDEKHDKRKCVVLQEKLSKLLPKDRFVERKSLFSEKEDESWHSAIDSLNKRIARLPMKIIEAITSDDTLELQRFGESNKILFIVRTKNRIPPMNCWFPTVPEKIPKTNWIHETLLYQLKQIDSYGDKQFDNKLADRLDGTMSSKDIDDFKTYTAELLKINKNKVFV